MVERCVIYSIMHSGFEDVFLFSLRNICLSLFVALLLFEEMQFPNYVVSWPMCVRAPDSNVCLFSIVTWVLALVVALMSLSKTLAVSFGWDVKPLAQCVV